MFLPDSMKTNGRVQVINGALWYSPNSHRQINRIPEAEGLDRIVMNNIFMPTQENIRASTNYSSVKLADYQDPIWWNLPFGWVAFIQRQVAFAGPVLRNIMVPRREDLTYDEASGYGLAQHSLENWVTLEENLKDIVVFLAVHTGSSPILPAYPAHFGYRHRHKAWKTAVIACERSRNWLVVWMGVMSYLIAIADTKTEKGREDPTVTVQNWYGHLLGKGIDQDWLDGLLWSGMIHDFSNNVERAGTIVSLPHLQNNTKWPRVEWLCHFTIPVWYLWVLEWRKDPKFASFAPLPHQLAGVAMADGPSRTLTPLSYSPMKNVEYSTGTMMTTHSSWAEWLADRNAVNAQTEKTENTQSRRERLARARASSKLKSAGSATVYEWVEGEDGQVVRSRVERHARDEILFGYEKNERHYDAFWHQWHCGTVIGDGGGYTDDDEEDDDEEMDVDRFSEHIDIDAHDVQNDDSSTSMDTIPQDPAHREEDHDGPVSERRTAGIVNNVMVEEATAGQSNDLSATTKIDQLEDAILSTLYSRFGYTGPLSPTDHAALITNPKPFVAFLGMTIQDAFIAIWERPTMKAAHAFFLQIASDAKYSGNEWDLSRTCRQSLFLNARLSCIKVLNVKRGKNRDVTETWFMFDLGSARTQRWMFTATTSAYALHICRLDPSYSDTDLAMYSLHNGAPFRTMQLSTTLTRAPYLAASNSEIKEFLQGHVFSITDFGYFQNWCTKFLKNNHRGRVACMLGGIPWRVSNKNIDWEIVLRGPCGWSDNVAEFVIGRQVDNNLEFMDDDLTYEEIARLCGLHHCSTGRAQDIEKVSWYPTPDNFDGSGVDYGTWTEVSESYFVGWTKKCAEPNPEGDPKLPMRGPINKRHWKSNVKGSKEMRLARNNLRERADEFLRDFLGGKAR
ncbi:hypothetical protein GALMADRAFT_146773 [Galerina marginata CBS 339.88]|uniref:Uncharacterized protein n=1 Tax=Galerina marginata (strain CBS 339.88) TaxID=685588 RepID=A0A067SAU5_GALM3|nr:hypothetical protein GALMADRAFT_146773 [Galerina marginata CBS 339.88]